jgi:molybdopterin/thiamine biosynthesis adenylyltransferase
MAQPFDYDHFVARNSGYISPETQARIRQTRLLIAGCGIGSSPAVCAARMGFENFVLVDGDVVDAHNLNRQFYDFADVGRPKVDALAEKILRINPQARIEAVNEYLGPDNTAGIVAKADLVFDTVDFLDLPAILGLHGAARRLQKPIFTALSVGFGALVWYFPADAKVTLPDILAADLSSVEVAGGSSSKYADVFGMFMRRLVPHLDAEVVEQVGKVLALMKDGKPCPASQVAVGSFAVAAMALSMIRELLSDRDPPAAPNLTLVSFHQHRSLVLDPTRLTSPSHP